MARRPRLVDPVGPLPPWLAYAAILLLDLLILVAVLGALIKAGDLVEDRLFPGGTEWVTF